MGSQPDTSSGWGPAGVDLSKPSVARIYDHLLGGKDNYQPDREAAAALLETLPTARQDLRANRAFLGRAVRFLAAECGISQFLDLGTGLPTAQNVHQVAQRVDPQARVVYVDNDPVVCAHARALLADEVHTVAVEGDIRDPDKILTHPRVRDVLDFSAPVGVLAVAILHFIGDADDPWSLLAGFRDAAAPGSFLALTHGADTPGTRQAAQTYDRTAAGPATVRSEPAIRALFDGFDLVHPGLVSVTQWRPDIPAAHSPLDEPVVLYGGVGRKPH